MSVFIWSLWLLVYQLSYDFFLGLDFLEVVWAHASQKIYAAVFLHFFNEKADVVPLMVVPAVFDHCIYYFSLI